MTEVIENSWLYHLQHENIVEKISFKNYRLVFIEVKNRNYFVEYIYRMLVFDTASTPILMLNLETSKSLAPFYCLGKNEGVYHESLGTIPKEFSYNEFKEWAIQVFVDIEMAAEEELFETISALAHQTKKFSNKVFCLFKEINQKQGSLKTTIKTLFGFKTDYAAIVKETIEFESAAKALCDLFLTHENSICNCGSDQSISAYFCKVDAFAKSLYGFCKILNTRQSISHEISKGGAYPYSEFQKIGNSLELLAAKCQQILQDLVVFEESLQSTRKTTKSRMMIGEFLNVCGNDKANIKIDNPAFELPSETESLFMSNSLIEMFKSKNTPPTLDHVKAAIKSGADINAVDKFRMTALILAAMNNPDPEIITALIDGGSNVNARSVGGTTPLIGAATKNTNPEVLLILLKNGANSGIKDRAGKTAFDYAKENEFIKDSVAFFELKTATVPPSIRRQSLIEIFQNENNQPEFSQVEAAIKAEADVNVRDENAMTALIWAAWDNKSSKIISAIIEAGADVNARSLCGTTPLIAAALGNENPEIIAILIKSGADLNAKSGLFFEKSDQDPKVTKFLMNRATALMLAAWKNKNPEVIATLIKAGADVNARDEIGWTALMLAAISNENPGIITVLVEAGADINARDKNGLTALMWAAAQTEKSEIIDVMLEAGADAKLKDKNGKTAFDHAQKNGFIKDEKSYWRLNDASFA